MSKKKLTYQEIKKAAKNQAKTAAKTQERLKRRKESDAYIPYTIPTTVFPGPKSEKIIL